MLNLSEIEDGFVKGTVKMKTEIPRVILETSVEMLSLSLVH